MMSIFYEPNTATEIHRRNLPHWMQQGRIYFVTFRLADSIPQERLTQIKAERERWEAQHRQPYSEIEWMEYYKLFSERVESWLDDNIGACQLAQQDCAKIVAQAFEYFDKQRYRLDHWVIMPNHVHILVMPAEPHCLKEILHSWKSYTATAIHKHCGCTGQFWQHESFDHIVRSPLQLDKFRRYIAENAAKCSHKAILSTKQFDDV
jgi:REP element-mobilizing transposase RayT